MACDEGPKKIEFASQVSAGISKWVTKYAFLAGRNRTLPPTSLRRISELAVVTRYALLGGLIGIGALALAYRGIKQRRYTDLQRGIPAPHQFVASSGLKPKRSLGVIFKARQSRSISSRSRRLA